MSGALREWIGPVLEEKLGTAFGTLTKNHWSEIHLEEAALAFQEGLLTIRSTKAKLLQVIDFHGHEACPSRVTLSDSRHFIRTTFNQDAIELYEKQSGRDFSSIKGGIVNIRDFYVVFDSAATSPLELTLQISKFNFIGAEGSRNIGSPCDISDFRSIQRILSQMKRAMSSEQSMFSQEAPSSQVLADKFQSTGVDCSLNLGAVSQLGFATQAEEVVRERVFATSVPSAASPTDYVSLLGLLKGDHKPKGDDRKIPSEDNVEKSSRSISTSISDQSARIPLAQVSNDRKLEMTSKLESLVNVSASHPKSSSESISSSCPNSQALPNSQHQATKPEDNIRSPTSSNRNHRHGNQQSCDQAPLMESIASVQKAHELPGLQDHGRGMAFVDQFQMEDPFKGLKRIPRKYLQIPKGQNAILEGDSWFDHANDCSYASIPKDVRDGIAAFVGQLNAKPNDVRSKAGDAFHSRLEEDFRPSNISSTAEGGHSPNSSGTSVDDSQSESRDPNIKAALTISNLSNSAITVESVQQELKQVRTHQNRRSASLSSEEDCEPLVLQCGAANMSLLPELGDAMSRRDTKPLIRNQVTPKYRDSRFPLKSLVIPSSSPSEEDEIELAVPLAVGDIVDASDGGGTRFDDPLSSEWPSTAVQDIQVVQVNQTPIAKSRSLVTNFQEGAELDFANPNMPRLDDVLSDPVIPATFHDVSPQLLKTTPKALARDGNMVPWKAATTGNSTSPQAFVKSSQNNIIPATGKWVDFEESREILQDVGHLSGDTNVQLRLGTPQTLSKRHAIPSCSNSALSTPNRDRDPVHNDTHSPFQTFNSCSPEIIDLPMHTSSSPIRLSYSPHDASPTPQVHSPRPQSKLLSGSSPYRILTTLKRSSEPAADSPSTRPSKRQRRRSIAAAILEEDECTPRDTKEMARASRHTFHELLPASTKPDISSAGVQGSQSGSPASTPDQFHHSTHSQPSGNRLSPIIDHLAHCNSPQDQLHSTPSPVEVAPVWTLENINLQISGKFSTFSERSVGQSNEPLSGSQPTVSGGNSWDKFKVVYPDYEGSESHFTKTLVYIEWLDQQNQLLQSCFCDDFIRVFACEYLDYIEQCKSLNVKPGMNGWQFYVSRITTRLYQRNVINVSNLQEALTSLDVERVEKYRQTFGPSATVPLSGQPRLSQSLREDRQTLVQSAEAQLYHAEGNFDSGEPQDVEGERNLEPVSAEKVPISRKPFFETRSQLLAAKQRRSSSRSSEGSRENRQPRTLPWPVSASKHSSSSNKRSPGSPSSSVSGNETPSSSQKPRQNSGHKPSRVLPQGSPILGRQYAPTPAIREDAARRARISSSGQKQVDKQLCSPNVEPMLQDEVRVGFKTPSEKRVEGWLDGVNAVDSRFKNDKFWKFARKRLSSGEGFSSRASTPSATPVKRFCTKPLEGASFGA